MTHPSPTAYPKKLVHVAFNDDRDTHQVLTWEGALIYEFDAEGDAEDLAGRINALLSGAATPAPTLTEEAAREYAELRPVSAEQIIRWWEEDKRRRAQGFKDDNWSRLLLSILHAFKDLANRDAKIASLTATPAPTAALTEEELLTPELIKKAADAGERVGWDDVLTPNAQIYHRAIDLKKYETALRAVLPIIIDRLAKSPPQGAEE